MSGILVYSEKIPLALELLTAAKLLAQETASEVYAICINNHEQVVEMVSRGSATFHIINTNINIADTASVAAALEQAVNHLDAPIVLLSSNRRGKELAGRLAQELNGGCLTDVSGLEVKEGKIICQRNTLGGATVATQYIESAKKVMALTPRSFPPASGGEGRVRELAVEISPAKTKVIEFRAKNEDAVDIETADVLVAVGQGLNSRDDLNEVEILARKLGGEVACSKPVATDKKWLPEDRIIGLSGKKCKPELAILLGISGQVQFTVGIRDAKNIVTVNTDDNASINRMADYILVDDLHQFVKNMNQTL